MSYSDDIKKNPAINFVHTKKYVLILSKRKESGSTIRFKTDFNKITSLYSSLKCFLAEFCHKRTKTLK